MLHKEFEDKIVAEIVKILGHYNSFKKYNLSLGKLKSKDAIKEEAKNVAQTEYIPCLKSIYKKLSCIIYSHHWMARFHSEYNEKTAPNHLRPLKERENKDI